jgi:hypothetical protein
MSWKKKDSAGSDETAKVLSLPKMTAVASRIEIKRELDCLKASAQRDFEGRRRFWFYPTLSAVYAVYAKWKYVRHSKKFAKIAAALYGIERRGSDPIRVIIDVIAPSAVDRKARCRWVAGLRFAWNREVAPKDFDSFCKKKGGIAGCARRFHSIN